MSEQQQQQEATNATTIAADATTIAAADAEARYQRLLAQGSVSQANASTCVYGDSGTGKTSLWATAAEYTWNRYRRTTRAVVIDPGGFGNKVLRLIRLGIVEVYNPVNHIEPFETMEDLSLGFWPEEILDPFTGFADPQVRLIAPQSTRWLVHCTKGHVVKTCVSKKQLQGFSHQCPECKGAPVTTQNWGGVEEVTVRAKGVGRVGLRVFDSGTSLQDWAMSDQADQAARGSMVAATADGKNALSGLGAKIVSGKYAFGMNTQQHYGFAQQRMLGWVRNARTIPGMVMPPVWTFLELRATDDDKRMAIFGPKIAGSAKTSDVPAWFGNCLHASKEENDKGRMEHRLWLVNHTDRGSTVPHLAKTRAEPGTLPDFLVDDLAAGDEPFTKFSLGYFFTQLETALEAGTKTDAALFADAPAFAVRGDGEEEKEEIVSSREMSGTEIVGGRIGGGVMPRAATATTPTPPPHAPRPPAGAPANRVAPAPTATPTAHPRPPVAPAPLTGATAGRPTAGTPPRPPATQVVQQSTRQVAPAPRPAGMPPPAGGPKK